MRVEYNFAVRNEIKMAVGGWPPLSFQRGAFAVEIPKPVFALGFFSRLNALAMPIGTLRAESGWAFGGRTTNVRIRLALSEEVPADGATPRPVVLGGQ